MQPKWGKWKRNAEEDSKYFMNQQKLLSITKFFMLEDGKSNDTEVVLSSMAVISNLFLM